MAFRLYRLWDDGGRICLMSKCLVWPHWVPVGTCESREPMAVLVWSDKRALVWYGACTYLHTPSLSICLSVCLSLCVCVSVCLFVSVLCVCICVGAHACGSLRSTLGVFFQSFSISVYLFLVYVHICVDSWV